LESHQEKCVFGVEAGRFLGFLLTERGIETNPEKCAAIITMRSPISVKSISAGGDKGHPYFQYLKRNNRFV